MEELILLILIIITICILKILFKAKVKEIKEIAEDEKVDKVVKKLPNNKEVCRKILEKLNNKNVQIEEEENTDCFYFIATNKIILNKSNDHFVRVQTIAHECIHSIQNKKLLWFNYIFSNLINLFFLVLIILQVIGFITNTVLWVAIFLIVVIIQYSVRSFLEIEAMTKAKYLACDYLQENNIKEVKEIENKYERLNELGIKYTCFKLLTSKFFMISIYIVISIIVNLTH